jgi:hypothetical protein
MRTALHCSLQDAQELTRLGNGASRSATAGSSVAILGRGSVRCSRCQPRRCSSMAALTTTCRAYASIPPCRSRRCQDRTPSRATSAPCLPLGASRRTARRPCATGPLPSRRQGVKRSLVGLLHLGLLVQQLMPPPGQPALKGSALGGTHRASSCRDFCQPGPWPFVYSGHTIRGFGPRPDRHRRPGRRQRVTDRHSAAATAPRRAARTSPALGVLLPVDGIYVGIFHPQTMSTTFATEWDTPPTRQNACVQAVSAKPVVHNGVGRLVHRSATATATRAPLAVTELTRAGRVHRRGRHAPRRARGPPLRAAAVGVIEGLPHITTAAATDLVGRPALVIRYNDPDNGPHALLFRPGHRHPPRRGGRPRLPRRLHRRHRRLGSGRRARPRAHARNATWRRPAHSPGCPAHLLTCGRKAVQRCSPTTPPPARGLPETAWRPALPESRSSSGAGWSSADRSASNRPGAAALPARTLRSRSRRPDWTVLPGLTRALASLLSRRRRRAGRRHARRTPEPVLSSVPAHALRDPLWRAAEPFGCRSGAHSCPSGRRQRSHTGPPG